MQNNEASRLPEIIVFAGPNGSGKTTITKLAKTIGLYINADDIKASSHCTDLEAAEQAEALREKAISAKIDFTFETVLSTDRNLNLLKKAKESGYFIRCIYVITSDSDINVMRVKARAYAGGHDVPDEKIKSRYDKALKLIPELVSICDIMHLYDNSEEPFRIFKKRKNEYFFWENDYWTEDLIKKMVFKE